MTQRLNEILPFIYIWFQFRSLDTAVFQSINPFSHICKDYCCLQMRQGWWAGHRSLLWNGSAAVMKTTEDLNSLITLNWITPKGAALMCCCFSVYRRTALECLYMSLCNLGLHKWLRIGMAWRFLRVILHCPLSGLLTLVRQKVCFVFLYSW